MKNILMFLNRLLLKHIDKVAHFLGCFFLTSIWLPLGIVFAIGKEVYDIRKRGFDSDNILDLLADGLGIGLAIIIGAF